MLVDERDADLLELIELLRARPGSMRLEEFAASRDEVDLASYRLAHIGEAARKLSEGLKHRHPQIRWRQMYAMRNVLAHEYPAVRPELLWRVLTQDLELLSAACREELDRPRS